MLEEDLVPLPTAGRVYRGARSVRLGDADPTGRLRFDACARFLHDLSNDDTRDADLEDDGSWVVRRTVLDVVVAPRFHERLALATWCGGIGSRWAERRVLIEGAKGSRVDSNSLWVYVDLSTMMPKRLGDGFLGLYGESADGRTVGSKLVLAGPPSEGVASRPWPLRRTDLDVLGHVNNASYWAALEELVGERPELVRQPHRAVVEFAKPIDPDMKVELVSVDAPDALSAWLIVDATVHATFALRLTAAS